MFTIEPEKMRFLTAKSAMEYGLIEWDLKQAGGESWTALNAALAESRKAFDRASQQAWSAFKGAAGSNI